MSNQFQWRRYIPVTIAIGLLTVVLMPLNGCNHGVGKAINDIQDLDEEVEKRNREIEKALSDGK